MALKYRNGGSTIVALVIELCKQAMNGNSEAQQTIEGLATGAANGDKQSTAIVSEISDAALQGDKEAAAALLVMSQIAQNTTGGAKEATPNASPQSMKRGAKIGYLRNLKAQCAEDEEMSYFKVGGKVCSKCIKKRLQAKKACGGVKLAKRGCVSKTVGGIIEEMKCGGKNSKKK